MKQLVTILITAIIAIGAAYTFTRTQPKIETQKSVYQTVLERGVLRCGYFDEAPFTIRDPNTGAMSGIAVELAEKIAADLELKLEWAEPIAFGTFVTDLNNRRYDAICGSVFMLPRAGKLDFTVPYAVVPLNGYVRPDITAFDKPLADIDWKNAKVVNVEGEASYVTMNKLHPEAQILTLPQSSQLSDILLSVAQSKADIGFVLPGVFFLFDKTNPGLLRPAKTDQPLYRFGVAFGLKPEEQGLKNMLDLRIREYIKTGELDALFDKYDPDHLFERPKP